jgi:isoleucyl-tRNA synthetase
MLGPVVPLLVQEAWSHAPALVERDVANPAQLGWFRPEETWDDTDLMEEFKIINTIHSLVKLGIEKAKTEQ